MRSSPIDLEHITEQIVDAHVGSILVTDARIDAPGPHISWVNAAFTRMFGYELHEVVGRSPRMFQGPLTDRAVLARLRRSLVRAQPFVGATINYRKDGSSFPVSWAINPLRRPGAGVFGFIAYQRDESRPDVLPEVIAGAASLQKLFEAAPAAPARGPAAPEQTGRTALADHIESVAARAGLSRREREVLDLLLLGRSHAMIAEALGITVRTVRFHQASLCAKLGADSRQDLFRIFL